MKRGFTKICAVFLSLLLCSCGDGGLLKTAKQSNVIQTAGLSRLEISDKGHGEIAYKYLEYIQGALPARMGFTSMERESAGFILSALFDMGYKSGQIEIQQVPGNAVSSHSTNGFEVGERVKKSQNIIVTKKGTSGKVIIVGAHYDSVGTHGADDNGSGVALALENAMRIVEKETPFTIRYIFFGAEELITMGSNYYVKSLSQKDNIVAMINVDSVIGGDTRYMTGGTIIRKDGTVIGSSRTAEDDASARDVEKAAVINVEAVLQAYEFAQELGLDIRLPTEEGANYLFPTGGYATSDYNAFCDNKIPYINFDAVCWDTGHPVESAELEAESFGMIMHSPEFDDLDFINDRFPGRVMKALTDYSVLLEHITLNLTDNKTD